MKNLLFLISFFASPCLGVALNPLLANVISGNSGNGVLITNNSSGNVVAGNVIGTNLAGGLNLGNGQAGVAITYGSDDNAIGGTALQAGNSIAFNNKGVVVGADITDLSINNSIVSNNIYSNAVIGIDLANDGPTQNHLANPTAGPNEFQNYPVLTAFTITNTGLAISWMLHSAPSSDYLLQFFRNQIGDPEGKMVVAQVTVTTDASGNAAGVVNIGGVPLNSPITATATQVVDEVFTNTSEFSTPLIYGVAPCAAKPCHR